MLGPFYDGDDGTQGGSKNMCVSSESVNTLLDPQYGGVSKFLTPFATSTT